MTNPDTGKKIELKNADYSEAKVGDTVLVTRYFSGNSDVKCTFKALVYGHIPKSVMGSARWKVKLLEMISPETLNVAKVQPIK